jgi:Amt family ammonium transporter
MAGPGFRDFKVGQSGRKKKRFFIYQRRVEMADIPRYGVRKMSLSEKFSRLAVRLRNPEWRKYGTALFAGKGIGIALVLVVMAIVSVFVGGHALAADPELKGNDIVNPVNTAWTLIAAFLVFGMQVGFTMLEAGFCRSRETVNVLVECVVDTCLCGLLFYAVGFAFMFAHGNGFIGYHWFFLQNAPATYEGTGVAFLAVWIFQFAFADTCSTITSGAMIGRTGFVGDLLYSICVTGFIYPVIGHWAWGPDGWLALMGSDGHFWAASGMGFHDFAGSTVVHTIGGFIALAGAIVLGPRLGRTFKRDGGTPMLPHDLTIAVSGGLILWFGWYGFNPGSTLSAMDFVGIGRVATNTTLAACAAGLSSIVYGYFMTKKWDAGYTTNGFLAGLVAITCPCYWVTPTGAVLLGGIAGVLVILGVDLLEWLRIDDPIGAVPVHGFCGIWGTLSLGLFASGQFGATGPFAPDNSAPLKGLFYGGGTQVLVAQIVGSAVVTVATFSVAMIVMLAVNATGTLRLPAEYELYGMDLHEHGISAYPEYVITALGSPKGLTSQPTHAPSAIKASAPAHGD